MTSAYVISLDASFTLDEPSRNVIWNAVFEKFKFNQCIGEKRRTLVVDKKQMPSAKNWDARINCPRKFWDVYESITINRVKNFSSSFYASSRCLFAVSVPIFH